MPYTYYFYALLLCIYYCSSSDYDFAAVAVVVVVVVVASDGLSYALCANTSFLDADPVQITSVFPSMKERWVPGLGGE